MSVWFPWQPFASWFMLVVDLFTYCEEEEEEEEREENEEGERRKRRRMLSLL